MDSTMIKTVVATATVVALAGCAPDAWTNKQATGLNAFINQMTVTCAPLEVGPMVITKNFMPPNYAAGQYDDWLDVTSRLYYQRITPQGYVHEVSNLAPFPGTIRAAQCVADHAPANVPPPPPIK